MRRIFEQAYSYWVVLFLAACFFTGCNKKEPIPSYIYIDKIDLTTNISLQGSNSHKIIDAWIYADDQLIGAFELPCTVPVLFEGSHEIKVLAGIKENGITDTRIVYPYYTSYQANVSLIAGELTTIHPVVNYLPDAQFVWIDDFDGAAPSICDSSITSDTSMQVTHLKPQVFEGIGSGIVYLVKGAYYGSTCSSYTLTKSKQVFLELNYSCNTEFSIGIEGYSSNSLFNTKQNILTLRPISGWNKVYINLTNAINDDSKSTKFKVSVYMNKDASSSSSTLLIDNIKLVN